MATSIRIQSKSTKNLNRYAGQWVVFVDNAIIAHDKALNEAMSHARKKGLHKKASVFLVPRKDEGPYILTAL
ncbi:MAG: hypothetical protein A2666_05180 [Parcubacteria group bacterium RIFCSPHIGHO2_01_FULL_47_10b]|nr:MAG: hypothetical protein A2666_05180 [Parcubacteria group bacterium RIFCSPHIGHO2_01_FULL_47_10b]